MLYKNPTGKTLTWRCGAGPGRYIDYTARPGGFVDGPDGYREPFRRAGFIPNDELPEDERAQIDIGTARVGVATAPKRPTFDDSVDDDEEPDPRAMPSVMPPIDQIPSLDAPPMIPEDPPPLPPAPPAPSKDAPKDEKKKGK